MPPKEVWAAVWRPRATGDRALSAGDLAGVQRRTVRTPVVAQAVGATGITIGTPPRPLLARDISPGEPGRLAQTFQVLGAAVAAYLLNRLMSRRVGPARWSRVTSWHRRRGPGGRRGRRVDGVLLGGRSAARLHDRGQLQRAVRATDSAEDVPGQPALSTVVWATTIGAVAGPNLTGPPPSRRSASPELTGPFALGQRRHARRAPRGRRPARPDPLLLARQAAGVPVTESAGTAWGRA